MQSMNLKAALTGQYRAGVMMVRQCIERCPDDLWEAASEHPRTFWRIAYHALFYTHFYCMPDHESFTPWERHVAHGVVLWDDDEEGVPPVETTYTQASLVEYCDYILEHVAAWVDALDLESQESGFPWYPIPKIDHQLVNVRHLGIHLGQLQELLNARQIDTDWMGKR